MNMYVQFNIGNYERPSRGKDQGIVTVAIFPTEVRLSFLPFSPVSPTEDGHISAVLSNEALAKHLHRLIRDKIASPEAALPETVPPKQQALRAWQDAQATERQAQQEWEQAWRQAQLAAAQGAWQAAQGAWQVWEQAQLAEQQARQTWKSVQQNKEENS